MGRGAEIKNSRLDLDELDRLEREATAGEWCTVFEGNTATPGRMRARMSGPGGWLFRTYDTADTPDEVNKLHADFELIAALRNNARALIDAARQRDRLLAWVRNEAACRDVGDRIGQEHWQASLVRELKADHG